MNKNNFHSKNNPTQFQLIMINVETHRWMYIWTYKRNFQNILNQFKDIWYINQQKRLMPIKNYLLKYTCVVYWFRFLYQNQ